MRVDPNLNLHFWLWTCAAGVSPKVDPSNQNLPRQVAPVQRHKASANAKLHAVLAPDIARVGASLVQKKTTPPSLHSHHPTKTVKLSRIHQRSHQTCRHSGSCSFLFRKKKQIVTSSCCSTGSRKRLLRSRRLKRRSNAESSAGARPGSNRSQPSIHPEKVRNTCENAAKVGPKTQL